VDINTLVFMSSQQKNERRSLIMLIYLKIFVFVNNFMMLSNTDTDRLMSVFVSEFER